MILAASGGYDIDNNHLFCIVLQRNKKPREFSRPHFFYTMRIIALRCSCLRPESTKLTRCGHTLDAHRDLKAVLAVGI